MKTFAILTVAAISLTACGSPAPEENADDFASRIGSGGNGAAVAQGTVAPTVATPLPGAAPGAFAPGTQTDPNSACAANKMGDFIGKLADDATRVAAQQAAEGASEVRFIAFGTAEYISPDPANPRLNLMLDQQNIIRDARCG